MILQCADFSGRFIFPVIQQFNAANRFDGRRRFLHHRERRTVDHDVSEIEPQLTGQFSFEVRTRAG
nr:hypothetical protein [Paraburkholderia sp. J63]